MTNLGDTRKPRGSKGLNLNELLPFPLDNPSYRRAILVLPPLELIRLYAKQGDDKTLMRGDVYYASSDLSYYGDGNEKNFLKSLDQKAAFTTFPIFLQDENLTDSYDEAKKINENVTRKWQDYLNICVSLGLRAYKIKINKFKSKEFKLQGEASVSLKEEGGKVNSNIRKTQKEKEFNERSFINSNPVFNLREAKRYTKECNLDNDDDIRDLFHKIVGQHSNDGVIKISQTINLFKQVEASFDTLMELKVPSFLTQLNTSFNSQVSRIEKYDFQIKLIFGGKANLTDDEKEFLNAFSQNSGEAPVQDNEPE